MKTIAALLFTLIIISFTGCASGKGKVLYTGTFEGTSFQVYTHVTHRFIGSRIDWRLKLRGHPALPISITLRQGTPIKLKEPLTTDWGPPYSDEIYTGYEHMYLADAAAYSNAPDDYSHIPEGQHDTTMLYMPAGSSSAEFTTYARLLKTQWAAADKVLTVDNKYKFPHIIGLVNGPRDLFVKRFRSTKAGVGYVLRIDPDGYVNLNVDDAEAEYNHMRHAPVQMPGKVIRLHTIYNIEQDGWTIDAFRKFRDSRGDSIEAYFRLEE